MKKKKAEYTPPTQKKCREFARALENRVNMILKKIHPQLKVTVGMPTKPLPKGPAGFVNFPCKLKFKSNDGSLSIEHNISVNPVNSEIANGSWWASHMLGLLEQCCQLWGSFSRDELRKSRRAITEVASTHLRSLS